MLALILLLSVFISLFLGYPALVWLLSKIRSKPVKRSSIHPFASVVICCFNEKTSIDNKIQNTLSSSYTKSKLEVIVVDSGSTDGTTEILENYNAIGSIKLVKQPERHGKASAINEGIKASAGELVILTDADAVLEAGSLEKLVENFADDSVGAAVGNVVLGGEGVLSKMNSGFYRLFRQNVREWESRIDSVSFFSGELLAFRKQLVEKVDEKAVSDDLYILFEVRKKGYRCVCDERAYVVEKDVETLRGQINHKRRTFVGTLQVFRKNWRALFNARYGFFGMLIAPAYVVRMLSLPFLILLISILLILYEPWVLLLTLGLASFAAIASRHAILALLYGIVVQIAAFLGILDYLTGNYTVLWSKKGK
jgi:biofilm PGA synthesis N-glycosyltransferase PgaC